MRKLFPAGIWIFYLSAVARCAAQAPDPLRLVPNIADVVIKIEHPSQLYSSVDSNPLIRQVRELEVVREFTNSTNAHRLQQLIGYFERQLGGERADLLDRLSGGGIALGVKIGPNPAPVMLVIQGKDEALMRRFVQTGLAVLEQELIRQESKDKIERGKYRGVEGVQVGGNLFAAVAGSALLVSNLKPGLQHGVDLYLDGDAKSILKSPTLGQSRDLLGPTAPAAWLWLNLDTVHKTPQAKEVFVLPRNDVNLTVLFGGLLDVLGRSPYACAGLYPQDQGFVASFRLPRGRDGMATALTSHVPLDGKQGSRPLLEPSGILYSASFYFDIAKFWENRSKLFNAKQIKTFEDFDKNSNRLIPGANFSKLTGMVGPYVRFVAVHPTSRSYKVMPAQYLPSFGLVLELREPEAFAKRAEALLRTGALFASTQVKLKTSEEKHGTYKLLCFRFPEDSKLQGDEDNYRFNFSPTFVTVGNQFIAASRIELCHELIDVVEKERKQSASSGDPATLQTRFYSSGGIAVLEAFKDRLYTQVMLDQAFSPDKAREQVAAVMNWVRQLGVLKIEENYREKDFRYELRFQPSVTSAERTTKAGSTR